MDDDIAAPPLVAGGTVSSAQSGVTWASELAGFADSDSLSGALIWRAAPVTGAVQGLAAHAWSAGASQPFLREYLREPRGGRHIQDEHHPKQLRRAHCNFDPSGKAGKQIGALCQGDEPQT